MPGRKPRRPKIKSFELCFPGMNEEAKVDTDEFFRRLSERLNVSEQEICDAKEKNGLNFGETYMATVLARRTNRNRYEVAEQYR